MIRNLLLTAWLVTALGPGAVEAFEPRRDGGAGLRLPEGAPVLFVVHGARLYDPDARAKAGIDRAVAAFVRRGWPVVSLVDCSGRPRSAPYLKDRLGTIEVCSETGEHSVSVGRRKVYVAGGFFEACALSAAEAALLSASRAGAPAVVHYVADALYTAYNGPDRTLAADLALPGGKARLDALWRYAVRDVREAGGPADASYVLTDSSRL